MKDKKKIERFIQLKVQNKTLDEMSKELGVDYETLARWNSEYKYEIRNKREERAASFSIFRYLFKTVEMYNAKMNEK